LFEHGAANAVIDHVHAVASSEFAAGRHPARVGVDQYIMAARGPRECDLVRRAHGADHACALVRSPLRKQLTHAARCSVDQHNMRRADREGIVDQVLGGEGTVQRDASPLERNALGHRNDTCRWQDSVRGVGADGQMDVGDPITDSKIAHAFAHGQHMA